MAAGVAGSCKFNSTMTTIATLDDDDELAPGEELRGMEIPIGFRLQISRPEGLDDSLVGRGVLLRMG